MQATSITYRSCLLVKVKHEYSPWLISLSLYFFVFKNTLYNLQRIKNKVVSYFYRLPTDSENTFGYAGKVSIAALV